MDLAPGMLPDPYMVQRSVTKCGRADEPLKQLSSEGGRWAPLVHPDEDPGGQSGPNRRRAEVLGVRDRTGPTARFNDSTGPRIEVPGGVPKRSTGWRCKRHGYAFAGSNPASPIDHQRASKWSHGDPQGSEDRSGSHLGEGTDHDPCGGRVARPGCESVMIYTSRPGTMGRCS